MPHPRSALVAGAIDGLIYAVGGENRAATGIVDVYNPATDTWTTLASMPTPRNEPALAVLDGRPWVAGGLARVDSSSVLSIFEVFRPPETTWWSSNTAVASIDPNGTATGLKVGTSTIDARGVGIDCATTGGCATLTVTGGGGGGECANVTFTLLPGSVPFTVVHLTFVDPSSGGMLFELDAPIGEQLSAPAGSYHLLFSAPAGYEVTPVQRGLNLSCGDDTRVQLRFRAVAPPTATGK